MEYESLHQALYALQATSVDGFEGLVLAQLGRLTGNRFFLAKGGSQGGKDMSTAGHGDTYMDVECKRYRRGQSPTTRDLLGGLQEAINASSEQLEFWLVVSTGAIGAASAEALRQTADRDGVAVEIVDWQEASLPELAILCAASAQDTLSELRAREVSIDLTAVEADLVSIAAHSQFADRLADLHRRLTAAELGLDCARAATNAWISRQVMSHASAMAEFNQALCVTDATFQPYINRVTAESALTAWYSNWATNGALAAVLGLEGRGKSWVTVGWWARLTQAPLTLLVTSNRSLGGDGIEIVSSGLVLQTECRDVAFWKRRVQQWLKRPPATVPAMLLILDGLNEQPRQSWQGIFASFADPKWSGRLAVIATCRPAFWSERIAPVLPVETRATVVEVEPFNDQELSAAWGFRQPPLASIRKAVSDFIRTPRVFRLARNHAERLQHVDDLTVERLLVEDWKDRRRLKGGLDHNESEFNNLIAELAGDLRAGLNEFGAHQLRDYSSLARRSPDRNLDRDFDEIIDGQLFERVEGSPHQFRVRPPHVGLALGILLARDLRDAGRRGGRAAIDNALAEHLEPFVEFDQSSAILRGAATAACLEPNYPAEARFAILKAWVRNRARDDSQWDDFAAFVPLAPSAYFDLAEDLWSSEEIDSGAREWVAAAILRWQLLGAVQELMRERCARWLGRWHPDWFPFLNRPTADQLSKQRQTVHVNWSTLTPDERFRASRLLHQGPSATSPWIARLALLLISHGPRAPHVEGLLAWALSRTIMKYPGESDEVAWCLRLNDVDAAETEAALLEAVELVLSNSSEISLRAARRLLWACGTRATAQRLEALPVPRSTGWQPPSRSSEVDPLDPASVASGVSNATDQLASIDLQQVWHGRYVTDADHRLEQIEPMLARFSPHLLAETYRRLLRSATERTEDRLSQLAWHVPEHAMLISMEEARVLDATRRAVMTNLGVGRDDSAITEAYLLCGVLAQSPADEQVGLLVERPAEARDLLVLEAVFSDLPADTANRILSGLGADAPTYTIYRTLWFLSRNAFSLDDASRQVLIRCFRHPDTSVRAWAFRVATICGDRTALAEHVRSTWQTPSDDEYESYFGSDALIAGANPVDYLSLRPRVCPERLGRLALRDGSAAAVAAFAADLDALFRTMVREPFLLNEVGEATIARPPDATGHFPIPDLASFEPVQSAEHTIRVFGSRPSPEAFARLLEEGGMDRYTIDRQQFQQQVQQLITHAQNAGHHFLVRGMDSCMLERVIQQCPEVVERWLQTPPAERVPSDLVNFFRSLCSALGTIRPELAADLLERLLLAKAALRTRYSPWRVDSILWLAFELPSNPRIDSIRDRVLDDAWTDERLFHIALAAQELSATDWLAHAIARDLAASDVRSNARALMLVGFLDEGILQDLASEALVDRTGFLKDVASHAERNRERNRRARHWFSRFLSERDAVLAWAAFRLFLKCADRRFFLWGEGMQDAASDVPVRWQQHVRLNDDEITRAATENEGKLEDTLFGLNVSRREIWPWHEAPSPAAQGGHA